MFVQRTNQFRIPGWELRAVGAGSTLTWFQTDPTYVLDQAEATVLIIDDDPPALPSVIVTALDPDAVESRGDTATLMFSRAGAPINNDLVVYYESFGEAVDGEDFLPLPGTVTIPAGQLYALVPVQAINDLFVEGNEELYVAVLPSPDYLSPGFFFTRVVIVDDDLPLVNIFAATATVGRGSGGSARVTVSRAGNLDESLVLNYLVTGTAVSGVDFNTLSGSVTIPAGQLSADVNITPIAGSPNSLPRTVTVVLSDSTTYNIFNQNSATITIFDNTLPTVTLSRTADTIGENGGTAAFVVTRTGPTTGSLNVFFEVGGSAWEGTDYNSIGTNIFIPAGSASVNINVTGINDLAREVGDVTGQDTIIVQLRPGASYNLGNNTSSTIRIVDDENDTALPSVGFMLRNSTVFENAGVAYLWVKVTANPATNKPIVVEYRVTSGNAVPNVDYLNLFPSSTNGDLGTTGVLFITHYTPPDPPPQFFDFENGIYAVPVNLSDDGVADGDKTLTITLQNPTGFQTNMSLATNMGTVYTNVLITRIPTNMFLGPSTTHTLTIQDLKTSTVTVGATATHAYEAGSQAAKFIIARDGATNVPLTVTYVVSGTAASGSDFVPLSATNTVTIPAGTNSALVTLTPLDDPTEEVAESVTLTVVPRTGYRTGFPDSATVILVSDDGTIQFSSATYSVSEDEGPALISVVRTGGTNLTTTVDYRFVGGSASNSVDYFGTNGVLTFLPGETVQIISIPIAADGVVESNETINLVLTNATGGVPLGGQNAAVVTIANDDTAFEFAATTFRGNENGLFGEVIISRRGVLTNIDTVLFIATNGSAGAADFLATTYEVEFVPGESNQILQVPILDDELFEGNETVNLTLANPSAGTSLNTLSNATLVIVDDECQIEFAVAGYSIIEYSNFVTLVVRRVGGTVNPLSVDYATIDGTATNGIDYVSIATTLTFTGDHAESDTNGSGVASFVPGDSVRTVTVPILDDILGEGSETFTVTLSNVQSLNPSALPGATLLGTNVTTTVTILDNELPGNVDYEFNTGAGANNTVRSVALAPRGGLVDFLGRVVIGGDFTTVNNFVFNRVARLLPDGAVDSSFNPGAGANSNVLAVAVQLDGKVLAGGEFTTMNTTNRPRLARLNGDGKLDLSFDLGASGVNGAVRAIALQANGQVLIGGDFGQVSGVARGFIARLQTNGVLDSNFVANVNGSVHAIAVQADGRIVIGGTFALVDGVSRASLARLNTNGTLDTSFAIGSGFNGPIRAVAVHTDGKILAGGAFGNFNTTNLNNLVRLDAFGALDNTFTAGTGPDGAVLSIATANNGRIVIGGAFSNYNAMPRAFFARLTPNGALDSLFNIGTGANGTVRGVVAQENSAIVIGGDFTVVNGLPRNRVARIHGDEFLDVVGVEFISSEFIVPEAGGAVATITVQRTGSTNFAFNVGYFTTNGTATAPADYLATNGVFSFAVGEMTKTFEIVVFDDVLVEGNETVRLFLTNAPPFVQLGALSTATLTILDSARSVYFGASEFSVNEAQTNALITLVRAGSLEGDVTITLSTSNITAAAGYDYTGFTNLITFTNGESLKIVPLPFVNNDGDPEFTETLLLRLSAPGSVGASIPSAAVLSIVDDDPGSGFADIRFNPGAGAGRFVRALALQPDGRLLVGGAFTNFANSNLNFLARLETNGLVDPSFTPGAGPDALVSGIGLSPDGRIAIGGAFTNYNGQLFNRVVRLTSNGVPDVAFTQPMAFDSAINGLASQPDGKILAGGGFKV
ncbi:MAG TPA: Calx-beta domain-containing protein, partial [Verrucomicrobiae bacterium]